VHGANGTRSGNGVLDARGEDVLRLMRRMIRAVDVHSRRLASDFDLTGPQLVCLRQIEAGGPASSVDLAREISVSPATLCGIVDRLEGKGLVERARQTRDKRRVSVSLTPAGRRALARAPDPLQADFAARFARLPSGERRQIESALQQLVELLEPVPEPAGPVAGRRAASTAAPRGR